MKRWMTLLAVMSILSVLSGLIMYTNIRISVLNKPLRHQNLTATKQNKVIPVAVTPPWSVLINSSSTSDDNCTSSECVFYVTTSNGGRLGNQLFAYASLFGIAWRNPRRIPLWNSDGHGLRKMFSRLRIPAKQDSPFVKNGFTTINEKHAYPAEFINETDRLPPSNIYLHGFLQFARYFAYVEDQLRYDFTFSADVINEAQNKLNALNAFVLKDEVRVIIHVRRTDMVQYEDRFLVQHLPEYLNRSMIFFTNCLPRVHFVVISDDITWCRQNIRPFGHHRVGFIDGKRSPGVDLAIASLCDHAIVTFGTYGWWAAWFANGVTLVPSQDTAKVLRPPVITRPVTLSLQ